MITLHQFALAQGRINRWRGLGAFALSIAQHQTVLSYVVPPELARAALVHDGSEVVLGGDIVAPIKDKCPDLIRAEEEIQRKLMHAFGVNWSDFLAVSIFDRRIRYDEAAALFPDDEVAQANKALGLGVIIDKMEPEAASMAWLCRFSELFGDPTNGNPFQWRETDHHDHTQGPVLDQEIRVAASL